MGKRRSAQYAAANVFDDKKHAAAQYKKNYEFKKKHSVRTPASEWDYERMHSDQSSWSTPLDSRERAMALGEKHATHGHGKKCHDGHLRLSGNPKAHQIGSRTAKMVGFKNSNARTYKNGTKANRG